MPLHAAPAAGFDEPFELMGACHERLTRTLDLLARLGAHLADQGCDAQARDAARDVLRYFTIAAPLHHEDEERHVLPRLRAQGRSALADRLQADHRVMTSSWAEIAPELAAIRDGTFDVRALTAARARWAAFAALHEDHIEAEEAEAYPVASAAMPEADLRDIGQEMAARRRS